MLTQKSSQIPEIKKIYEINETELNELQILTTDIRKKYVPDDSFFHDSPDLPDYLLSDERPSIVVIALGDPADEYPELQYNGHTLMGFFGTNFFSYERLKEYSPWMDKDKKPMSVCYDRIYTAPPFRGNGVAKKLLHYMEDVLKNKGYGNMEMKPDQFLKKWLVQEGFKPISEDRYNKSL